MAVDSGTIYSEIRIKLDKMNGDIEKVLTNFDKIGKGAKETKKNFDLLGAAGQAFSFAFGFAITDLANKVRDWAIDVFFSFEKANAIIGKSTGAIGQDLEELNRVFTDVLAEGVEQSSDEVAAALGELNTRLGATGGFLKDLTIQVADFADVTDTNMKDAVVGVTKVMSRWNIESFNTAETLDKIAKASQMSGISATVLMDTLTNSAAQLKAVNFSFDESVALIAAMEKAGIRTENVMAGFNKAVSSMASNGKDAKTEIQNLFSAIQNAEDPTKATALAVEVFGYRAGPELTDALRSGKLNIEEWTAAIAGAKGTVQATDAATDGLTATTEVYANKTKAAVGGFFKQIGKNAVDTFNASMAKASLATEFITKIFNINTNNVLLKQADVLKSLNKMKEFVTNNSLDAIKDQEEVLRNLLGNAISSGDKAAQANYQSALNNIFAQKKAAEDAAAKAKADSDKFFASYTFENSEVAKSSADTAEQIAKKKEDIEAEYSKKILDDKVQILELEKNNEIAKANEVGADTANIIKYYDDLIKKQQDEDRELKKQKDLEAAQDTMDKISTYATLASDALGSLFDEMSRQELAAIEARYQAELEANGLAEQSAVEKAQEEVRLAQESGDAEALAAAQTALKKAEIDKKYAKEKATAQYNADMADWNNKWIMSIVDGAAAVAKAGFLTPLGIATGIAAAIQTGIILSNQPKPPAFETGGIVPGSNFSGDKVLARVNSGEGIFTQEQMQALGMMANGGSGGIKVDVFVTLGKYAIDDVVVDVIERRSDSQTMRINKAVVK